MIECHLQTYSLQSLTVIEDLYAPGWNVEPQWSVSTAKRIVMQESHVQRISENIMIPETYPAALQLFGTSGTPHVDDFYTIDGTLNADGILNLQLLSGTQDADEDGQVVQGPDLLHMGWCQVDGDMGKRKGKTAVFDGRTNTLAGFLNGSIGQTDGIVGRQCAACDIHLNVDLESIQAI